MKAFRHAWTRATVLGSVAVFTVAACSSGSSTGGAASSTAPSSGAPSAAGTSSAPAPASSTAENVTLKIAYWGDFGLDDLAKTYEAAHPNVHIQLVSGEYNAQHQALQKYLVAGSGAPDIAAIDEGFIVQFRSQPDKFVNFLDEGMADKKDQWLPWKWTESLSADGKTQIGLGTDVGGQAMCYRRDLFKQAGLPSDRDAVSKLWPTWDDFVKVGQEYQAGIKDPKKRFVDAATNILNPVLAQQPVGYFTTDEKLAMDGGPKVAWDTAVKISNAKLSAGLPSFAGPAWDAGFTNGTFATIACPAWMMGYIQGKAPKEKGNWDVAAIPGGGGNWGGSFFTVPKQGKHIAEAVALAKWLTEPEQELSVFKKVGNLPSEPALYDDPALTSFTNPFFNNAPVGAIFSATAKGLNPQYLGKKNGPVRVAVENDLKLVEKGQLTPDKGWAQAVKDAQKAAAG